jgi:hypothetical protein
LALRWVTYINVHFIFLSEGYTHLHHLCLLSPLKYRFKSAVKTKIGPQKGMAGKHSVKSPLYSLADTVQGNNINYLALSGVLAVSSPLFPRVMLFTEVSGDASWD